MYPKITFRDENGPLPEIDGLPHIRQFQGEWWVQLSTPWEGKVALKKRDGQLLELTSTDKQNWFIPKDRPKKRRIRDAVKTPAGTVLVKLTDEHGRELHGQGTAAKLEVLTANIGDEELEKMLRDIGLLALSTSTYLYGNLAGPVPDQLGEGQIGGIPQGMRGYFRSAESLLRLGRALQQNWAVITKRPLREIKVGTGINRDYYQVRSPQMLVKAYVRGPHTPQLGLRRLSGSDCSENQFLCHLLDHYLILVAEGTAALLQSSQGELVDESVLDELASIANFEGFTRQARARLSKANQVTAELNKTIAATLQELQQTIEWAKKARRTSFLKDVSTPRVLPEITQRLLGTPGYAAVVREFFNSRKASLDGIQHVLSLFTELWQGNVKATWELYEIWCLVRLYSSLITQLHLRPEDGRSLFDQIKIKRGELVIPTNTRFGLRGTIPGGPTLAIGVYYEKELPKPSGSGHVKPDIFLEIDITRGSRKKELQVVFDAKYRDYNAQGIPQVLEDVEGCARDKYGKPFNLTAAFILHTDEELDFWGEKPLAARLNTPEADRSYLAHRLGAISLRPGYTANRQLRKIFGLILHYHGEQRDICIHCARALGPGTEITLRPGTYVPPNRTETKWIEELLHTDTNKCYGIPLYCNCQTCGRVMVIQHCVYRPSHAILKTGELCLHEPIPNAQGNWWYKCPVCGEY
ncbi:MAG TPA: hypothetical protein GX008_01055 [Firmicutes bacterium]|jgi:hypothetical protein|nr:MAG: hypothetical protein AA931_08740 [Peptococcaceae bacterium 1109]HHT72287.1 hypothetical protein [Bacillota bacterium]